MTATQFEGLSNRNHHVRVIKTSSALAWTRTTILGNLLTKATMLDNASLVELLSNGADPYHRRRMRSQYVGPRMVFRNRRIVVEPSNINIKGSCAFDLAAFRDNTTMIEFPIKKEADMNVTGDGMDERV
jgi:hypothetical protein